MRRKSLFVFLGLIALLGTGCGVSKEKYMKLEDEKKELEQSMNQLTKQKEDLASDNEGLQLENRRLLQERSVKQPSQEEGVPPEESTSEESPLK